MSRKTKTVELTSNELYSLRCALCSYIREHVSTKGIKSYESSLNKINDALIGEYQTDICQPEELTLEEKISCERVNLAKGGRLKVNSFFNTAIHKIKCAKTKSYAHFRMNFACEVLSGGGFCNGLCDKCKLGQVYEKTIAGLKK